MPILFAPLIFKVLFFSKTCNFTINRNLLECLVGKLMPQKDVGTQHCHYISYDESIH